jgi:alkylation response protein AidB-like acyl-CoA dehydrogenase
MKLQYDAETEAFRRELRAWIAANQPDPEEMRRDPSTSSAHMPRWAREWQRRLFDAGWLVPGWPPALGGRDATPVQQLVYFEEMDRAVARRTYNPQGLSIILPSLRDFAGPELQERFVLPTLRAEIAWCLGMSEPGAGSDLAGLATRAELRGDHFVVRGQKVWTSGAHFADWCFCFVRTDPAARKHRGISVLVIDMKTPGIRVRPMAELTDKDHADFNEVFFDDVRVPRDNLVGQLNNGWAMATGSLAHERGMLWIHLATRLEGMLESVARVARRPDGRGGRIGDDPRFRDQYAAFYVDVQALRLMGYRGFAKIARGQVSPEHSVLKLVGSELEQGLALLALEALGAEGLDVDFRSRSHYDEFTEYPWARQYLRSFGQTIAGGTSEIQRNIVAQRVLGLPRR